MARAKSSKVDRESPGWLFLGTENVPDRWRDRAVPCLLVPLLPEEAAQILTGYSAIPEISRQDEELARLLARGHSGQEIAQRLGITRRSVDRRLARLREALGVRSTAELASLLASKGF